MKQRFYTLSLLFGWDCYNKRQGNKNGLVFVVVFEKQKANDVYVSNLNRKRSREMNKGFGTDFKPEYHFLLKQRMQDTENVGLG